MSGRGLSDESKMALLLRANAELFRALESNRRKERVIGCVELALRGDAPAPDWPEIARKVSALVRGEGG